MSSPVKAVGQGALAFALGGVLLAATSSGPPGDSAPGSAGDDMLAAPPVEVSGELVRTCGAGPQGDPVSREYVDGIEHAREWMCAGLTYRWSDPRLDGRIVDTGNSDMYVDEPDACDPWKEGCHAILVHTRTITIENADGAGRMRAPLVFISTDYPADRDAPGWLTVPFGATWVLDGEGAYGGLVAVIRIDVTGTAHGAIIDGDVPPPPQPFRPE
jgi:hypothetical protein